MTTSFFGKVSVSVAIAVVLSAVTSPVFSQDTPEFAEYLMAQRDYFRGITVYKRLLFNAASKDDKFVYSDRIATAYRLSGKHKSSIYFHNEALKNASAPKQEARSLIGLGLNYYQLKTIPMARVFFKKAEALDESGAARLYEGMMQMEARKWHTARSTFEEIVSAAKDTSEVVQISKLLFAKSREGEKLPSKSPALAAFMSSVLPGSGQIYAGHTFDGLQAMAYVGAFSLATYGTYRYDRDVDDSDAFLLLSAGITAVFYTANIFGAHQTAKFRNRRIKQNFMNDVRKLVFEAPF